MTALQISIYLAILLQISTSQQKQCTNLVPGLRNLAVGVDLSTFDTLSPVYCNSGGYVQNITCNQGRKWTAPWNQEIYDVPDQLSTPPLSISVNVAKYDSFMMDTSYQLEVDMAVSIHESYLFGMASKTESISNSYKYTSEEYRFLGYANSTAIAYEMTFFPSELRPDLITISLNAQASVDQLPAVFNASTVDNYETFIKYFGTHYATNAYAGGTLRCDYYTQKSFTSVMDTASIQAQGGFNLDGFLQKSGAVAVTVAPVAKAWIDATKFTCTCYGGAGCPDSQPSYEQWLKDLWSVPHLFELSFDPIYNLISDPIRATSMKLAVSNHFTHSYLQYEVIPALNIFTVMIKNGLVVSGNPACPIPDSMSNMAPCGTPCNGHTCCSSSLNGHYCRTRNGAPFTTDYNNVKTQQPAVNSSIYALLNEANVLVKEPIINITQLTQFANQFISLVNVMETGIATKTCQFTKPQTICRYCSNFNNIGFIYCNCNEPSSYCCGSPTVCPTSPGPMNRIAYLAGLDHP
eukprot:150484_1